ncbi:hypothetical protein [Bradyrhizobium liaoningense]|uniref:hypothetical protein n=1 Tax=Bradyrhizobium liaoningense TaxID=43992 RepID=UPI001BAD4B95|nr:hypothetical protein [Bradyrhizobium liaoningense]MBR1165878.1 hypothetical protein [Bradyrhizobium liaoningense]
MIKNIPTADELLLVSLRLYFKAWGDLASIITEWAEYGEWATKTLEEDEAADVQAGWQKYIGAAQSDLQSIFTLIQQSQEIGLKARICEVSPYLLLKRIDIKPSDGENGVWDFTDFPTLDASELVRVHNMFCSTTLSKDFQAKYEEIRRGRNKISHLGIFRQNIEPLAIIDILQLHYSELYPWRRWMEDRLHFAALGKWADFSFDSNFDERTGLYTELWHLLPELSESQFKWLMGHERREERFICHQCGYHAQLGHTNPYASDVPTAYPVGDDRVRCVICDKEYPIRRAAPCLVNDCKCEWQSALEGFEGLCMKCGWAPEEWEEFGNRKKMSSGT